MHMYFHVTNTFLVGERVTLADITVVCNLLLLYKQVGRSVCVDMSSVHMPGCVCVHMPRCVCVCLGVYVGFHTEGGGHGIPPPLPPEF